MVLPLRFRSIARRIAPTAGDMARLWTVRLVTGLMWGLTAGLACEVLPTIA
jgi:hypothetical protein